jgi:hypothetical protein
MYRAKALVAGQRAKETSDPTAKQDREELAIEWHMMASIAAKDGKVCQPARPQIRRSKPACAFALPIIYGKAFKPPSLDVPDQLPAERRAILHDVAALPGEITKPAAQRLMAAQPA